MGDTGSWSFTSTVLVQPITQAAPTSGSTTAGTAFTDHLVVTGANGAVTYTTTSATAPVTVSSSGAVIASSTVPAGTYTLTGTDTDTVGDNGTWVYSLTVSTAGPARADLSVSLAAPATVHTGSAVTVTVTNSGPGTATKVGSALLVPSGWTLTNAGGGTVIARSSTCSGNQPSAQAGPSLTP